MATYSMGQWRNAPQRKAKKVFNTISRVIDFSVPPYAGREELGTTAWAVGDVVELVGLRSDQVVLSVEVEILKKSKPDTSRIQIGYGTDVDRWGTYKVDQSPGVIDPESDNKQGGVSNFAPLRFSSSDTIDVKMFNQIMTAGRVKITVYILEDGRSVK